MTPKDVVNHLRREVYVRLGVSSLGGIGVIAIRDIPEGIDPFQEKALGFTFVEVPVAMIDNDPMIPEGVRKDVHDICANGQESVNFPCCGMNGVTPLFYLNHSDTPNIKVVNTSEAYFATARSIHAGEELTVNYFSYNEKLDF
jgi:hypothetical protein